MYGQAFAQQVQRSGFKQKHPVVDAMNPWGSQFDTNMVWGPINGAMGYIGIRVNFGRL